MTAQILSFDQMKNFDPALLDQMMKQMAALQAEQRRHEKLAQKAQSNHWQNMAAAPQDQGMGMFMGLFLAAALFGGFNSPLMGGLTQLGMMNNAEDGNNNTLNNFSQMNSGMKTVASSPALPAQKNDPMNMLFFIALVLKMMQGNEENTGRGGNGGMVAMNPLNDNFVFAQFKQNRQKIVSLKELMGREKERMFVKSSETKHKLACN
jgi:hypothetical protein